MRTANNDRWHFTVQTSSQGNSYVYAYQTKWDPVSKTSRRCSKRYVGRLTNDGRVNISDKFAKDFPEYSQGDFYYGADKELVDEATYRHDFPAKSISDTTEDNAEDDTRSAGLTWAIEQIAIDSGLLEDLTAVFKQDARDLLHLAIYKLDGGRSMAAYDDWRRSVYLRQARCLSSQRISEILSRVTQKQFEDFFCLRHKRKLCETDSAVHYALDNTSISTYSETIEDAAFGHAKRDPQLKQINYTFVSDQKTGDIVFAHTYEGSINDVVALKEVLYHMQSAGLDLEKVVLVTDRGYCSLLNVQKMLNLNLKFIQGVRLTEDSIKRNLDRYREALRDVSFYDADLNVYARSIKEPWTQNADTGRVYCDVFQHLYRFPGEDEAAMRSIVTEVNAVLDTLAKGNSVAPDTWRTCQRFLRCSKDKKTWTRNDEAIRRAIRYAGTFVIRSNVQADPFKALEAYRMRSVVEMDFEQFKNWVDGDRLRCTQSSYLGKLFICTIATSLRLMMLRRAHDNESAEVKIPFNSMDCLMAKLRSLKADKRRTANAWILRAISKKQRELLSLLSVDLPPKVLR